MSKYRLKKEKKKRNNLHVAKGQKKSVEIESGLTSSKHKVCNARPIYWSYTIEKFVVHKVLSAQKRHSRGKCEKDMRYYTTFCTGGLTQTQSVLFQPKLTNFKLKSSQSACVVDFASFTGCEGRKKVQTKLTEKEIRWQWGCQ